MVLLTAVILGVSIDCPNMINLALGLHVDVQQSWIMDQLRIDCCTTSGVTCDNNRVTGIAWNQYMLDGTLNGTALPSSLLELHLWGNEITGRLPSKLPDSLENLDIDGNKLVGDVPTFPNTLTTLWLGSWAIGNRLTGTVRLNKPGIVYIVDNWITDIIITDSSIITGCDLSNNPLLGNPQLVGLSMCTKNNLYSASLLPKTISSISAIKSIRYTTAIAKTSLLTSLKTSIYLKSTISSKLQNITPSQTLIQPSIANLLIPQSSLKVLLTTKEVFTTNDVLKSTPMLTNIQTNYLSILTPSSIDYSAEYTILSESFTSFNEAITGVGSSFVIPTSVLDQPEDFLNNNVSPVLIYGLMGGLGVLCIVVVATSLLIKNPKMHSKFGRKNSFGTLNTVNTTKTAKSY